MSYVENFNTIERKLGELEELIFAFIESKSNVEVNPHERLTRKEIKEQYKVCFGTIHNAMKSGKLPFNKVGRKTLFLRSDVENYFSKK